MVFHARLTKHVSLGHAQTVVFDNVITTSVSYNQHSGHLTAPYNGTYNFASTFVAYSTGTQHLQMIKNDNVISGGHAPSPLWGSASGSMNTVVTLMKDDIVFIRHFAGADSEIIQGNWSKMNFLSIRLSIIIFLFHLSMTISLHCYNWGILRSLKQQRA